LFVILLIESIKSHFKGLIIISHISFKLILSIHNVRKKKKVSMNKPMDQTKPIRQLFIYNRGKIFKDSRD